MAGKRGIAARAGSWSVRHRWAAVGIWILFVVLAMGLGSATGTEQVKASDQLPGTETGQSMQIVEDAGLDEPAGESVLIQAKDGGPKAESAEFHGAVDEVIKAVQGTGEVTAPASPYDTRTISKDGRSALVHFNVRGEPETAADRVQPVLDAVQGVQDEHEDTLLIEEIGDASMNKTFDEAFGDDFQQAEFSAVPIAFGIPLPRL